MIRAAALALMLVAVVPGAAQAAPIIAWTYRVRAGDTIDSVAGRMGVSPDDLAGANGIAENTPLPPGIVLKRPDPHGAPRQDRARTTSLRATPVVRSNPGRGPVSTSPHRTEPGTPHLIWPTSGAVTDHFGSDAHARRNYGPNKGIDLAAYPGLTVRAAAAGRVLFAGTEPERFGQLIVIDHGGGWTTAYAYLGKVAIRQGETVRAGTAIARIGTSGEAKKPMLHFELRHNNVPCDPIPALPIRL